ncbi:MAG: hypothetical protein VB144_11430 [Clostridia bacterium]|nr:hypothetical protein [Clostridia bacterium]
MAAIDDAWCGKATNIAKDAYADIRPASGHEVSLAYLAHGYPGELYLYDGTTRVFVTKGDVTCMAGDGLRLTNSSYAQFKNTHSAAQDIMWSGTYTKTPA